MNISFNQLRVLQAVAKHKSYTKAAKELNMTQPAISIQIKNLQDQFEVPLIETLGKKIHITEFGFELVETAERIFSEMDLIEQKMLELKGLLAGKIRISAVSTGKYIIPYLVSDFMKINPHVEISLEVSNRYKVLAHLEENTTDLALVSLSPEDLDLQSISLAENRLFLVTSPQNAEEYQKYIDNKEFSKIPFILREKGSGTRLLMEKFFKKKGIDPTSKMELATNEAVKQAVMAGLGASILSEFSMTQEVKDGRISLLNFSGMPITADWKLIWMEQKKHSPAVKAFIRWLEENKEQVIKNHFSQF
ncbi:LysR family transcriptional regulator [Algoriphagus sp. CAU 1675]|uniref:LysR family transcriptional regulator n=1 Tax=Algoriphagus sp. CAU 1675 TaxID=3032597 RepID=UPI0023DC55BB|nr:LysR family transcriptional regulator [Algoriphagus sp. CAU 1675]MDF2157551.1 LysR family transcriptional regulator [Algoriphagus sp. CAU 1675]